MNNMKPVIGISGNQLLKAISAFEGTSVSYTPQNFVNGVQQAGAAPLILPVGSEEAARTYVGLIDALILTGGHDVNPMRYNESPHKRLQAIFPQRDTFDLALLDAAIKKGIPVLGVCRGMQIVNVYYGGSLYQDIDSQLGDQVLQHIQKSSFDIPIHKISVEKESYLHQITGKEMMVNSFHHQAIKVVGKGLNVVANSPDGIIEAVEAKDADVLAIQWHPETMLQNDQVSKNFFIDLVKRAQNN